MARPSLLPPATEDEHVNLSIQEYLDWKAEAEELHLRSQRWPIVNPGNPTAGGRPRVLPQGRRAGRDDHIVEKTLVGIKGEKTGPDAERVIADDLVPLVRPVTATEARGHGHHR